MTDIFSKLGQLPLPAKVAAGVTAAGGISLTLASIFNSRTALIVVVVGAVVVSLIWSLYSWLLKRRERKQAALMQQSIVQSAALSPTGIANPARRAKLDELRKTFESGVEKFRAAGKDVYSVPWYVVVGEPGSGKTEAIRRCKIGFPPGLQDPQQGVGGTVNMNWWFTNHGVFLDTAGRLMFEEVEAGATSEWQEFLKLLVRARPNCPINGLMLFIAADSLIKDRAEEIERKGSRIAQQFDQIQRSLGIRFPVYVIISKCDKVNGFREFFDDINDPRLQDQIIGWANPAPLDEPFKPESVESHLEQVQSRLTRRRFGLLMDPVHTEDQKSRRTDQVDALYAFPHELSQLGTRLRRYLEMVFVAGQWSAKPLFLRGIFFNSALREGDALDRELAQALGVEVERLPEGRVWEKDRSFFLRDVFMEKAFPEKGLVSRASNVSKQQRAWRLSVMGLVGGGALVVALLTWLGVRQLNQNIVDPSKFWASAQTAFMDSKNAGAIRGDESLIFPVLKERQDDKKSTFAYLGAKDDVPPALKDIDDLPSDLRSIGRFPLALKVQAEREVQVPTVFRGVAAIMGETGGNLLQKERRAAARMMFESSWLRPVFGAARIRLSDDITKGQWSTHATDALAQLIRTELAGVKGLSSDQAEGVDRPDMAALLRYALSGTGEFESKGADKDAQELFVKNDVMRWMYPRKGSDVVWPPPTLAGSRAELIESAVKTFNNVWTLEANLADDPDAGPFPAIKRLLDRLREFETAETALLQAAAGDDPALVSKAWSDRLKDLHTAADAIDADLKVLGQAQLPQAYKDGLKAFRAFADKQYAKLMSELELARSPAKDKPAPLLAGGAKSDPRAEKLVEVHKLLADGKAKKEEESKKLTDDLGVAGRLDTVYLGAARATQAAYKVRLAMYDRAEQRLVNLPKLDALAPGDVGVRLADINTQREAEVAGLGSQAASVPGADKPDSELGARFKQARDAVTSIVDLAARVQRTSLVDAFLKSPLGAPGANLGAAVAGLAEKSPPGELARPNLPLATFAAAGGGGGGGGGGVLPAMAIAPAGRVLSDFIEVQRALSPQSQSPLVVAPRLAELKSRFDSSAQGVSAYAVSFADYWSRMGEQFSVALPQDWAGTHAALAGVQGPALSKGLDELVAQLKSASSTLDPVRTAWPTIAAQAAVKQLASVASQSETGVASVKPGLDTVMNNWRALGSSTEVAQRTIVAAGAAVKKDYIALPSLGDDARTNPVDLYLRAVWCGSMSALARERTNSPQQLAVSKIGDLGGRFPLFGPVGGTQLSRADVDDLRTAVDDLAKLGPLASAAADAPPVQTGNDCVDRAVAALQGMRQVKMDDADFARNVSKAVTAMFPAGGALTCRVVVDSATSEAADPDSNLARKIPLWSLEAGGVRMDAERYVYSKKAEDLILADSITLPGSQRMELVMREMGGRVEAKLDLGGAWMPLEALAKDTTRQDLGGRQKWLVKIPVRYNNEDKFVYLRLEFNRSLPVLRWLPN